MLVGIVGGVPHPLLVSVMAAALRPSRRRSPEPDRVAANEAPGVKPALTATCQHEFGGFLLVSKLGKGLQEEQAPRASDGGRRLPDLFPTCAKQQGMP